MNLPCSSCHSQPLKNLFVETPTFLLIICMFCSWFHVFSRKWLSLVLPWLQWASRLILKVLTKVRRGSLQYLESDPVVMLKALLLWVLQQKQIKFQGKTIVSLLSSGKKSKTPSSGMKAKPRWVSCRQKVAKWVFCGFFSVCMFDFFFPSGILMYVIWRFFHQLLNSVLPPGHQGCLPGVRVLWSCWTV